VIDMDQVLYST